MADLTKAQRRHIRDLAVIAHGRELGAALDALNNQFKKWQSGELDPWELNEEIHQHHNGIARELYKAYVMGDAFHAVGAAVVDGILELDEVREDCRPAVEGYARGFKRYVAEDAGSGTDG